MKTKVPYAQAIVVAERWMAWLAPACVRVEIVGSVRRRKAMVGDIELLYIPKMMPGAAADFFVDPVMHSLVDVECLPRMLHGGWLAQRLNKLGRVTWGEEIKFGIDVESGIAIDFFATSEPCWWNALVCKTGGAESNTQVATAAMQRGWKWCPTREGFERRTGPDRGRMVRMGSEEEVFRFVGMPYLEPSQRA